MASAAVPEVLRENMDYLRQLQQSYRGTQDPTKLGEIRGVYEDVRDICQNREADVRNIIKSLSSQVAELEDDVRQTESKGSAEGLIQGMKTEVLRSRDNVAHMQSEERWMRLRLVELQRDVRAAEEENQAKSGALTRQEEQCRLVLGLYAHVSRATFDEVSEERVTGVVSDTDRGDIVTFDLPKSSSTCSTDDTGHVDRLWELVN